MNVANDEAALADPRRPYHHHLDRQLLLDHSDPGLIIFKG